jgi:hypothetical protein
MFRAGEKNANGRKRLILQFDFPIFGAGLSKDTRNMLINDGLFTAPVMLPLD